MRYTALHREFTQGSFDTELERLEKSLSNLNAGMDDGGEGATSLQHQLMEAQNKAARLKTDEIASTQGLSIARSPGVRFLLSLCVTDFST